MGVTASTIAIVGLVMGGVKAHGEMQEGEERAKAEEFNADVTRQQANLIKTRGRLDVMRQRKAALSFQGTQAALYAKAGVMMTGSPLAVMEESAANAELDILTTEFNTQIEASRLTSEAQERDRLAGAERKMGKSRAGKTLLTTAASAMLAYGGGGTTGYPKGAPKGLAYIKGGETIMG